jgi:general secretion pathway protein N
MRLGADGQRAAILAAGFILALVLTLPLRVAIGWTGLEERGLSAGEVTGSVWSGSLLGARFGEVALGDVDARLRALPLLVGRARLDVGRKGGGVAGGLMAWRDGAGVEDVSGTLTGPALAGLAAPALTLDDFSGAFRGGLCDRAEGRVTAQLLSLGFTGEARCEGAALRLPLTNGRSRIDLRISADGRYRADVAVPAYSGRVEGAF